MPWVAGLLAAECLQRSCGIMIVLLEEGQSSQYIGISITKYRKEKYTISAHGGEDGSGMENYDIPLAQMVLEMGHLFQIGDTPVLHMEEKMCMANNPTHRQQT